MNVLVATDGSPASTKAIELAAFAGGPLMARHDRAQLVIAHMWEKSPTGVFSADSLQDPDSADAAPAAPLGPQSVEAAVRAADFTINSEATELQPQLPLTYVVHRALRAVHESKGLRGTLNYKIETQALPPPVDATPQPEQVNASPKTKAAAARQKNASRPPTHPPRPGAGGAAAAAAAPPADAPGPTEEDEAAAKEEARRHAARQVVAYAGGRAAHHDAVAIAMGVGNTVSGKALVPGSVAVEALHVLGETYMLWFTKADGLTLRPSTAAVRYVVVVPILAAADGIAGEDVAAAAHTVKEALRCRRAGSGDRVAVLLTHAPVDAESDDGRAVEAAVAEHTEQLSALLEAEEEEEEEAAAGEGGGDDHPISDGEQAADAHETTSVGPSTVADHAETAAAQWPSVSVFVLKPSKHFPAPTVLTATAQVTKFIQQRKTDIVVVSAGAPEQLQLALMSMPKPHCLVVPKSKDS